MEKVLFVLSRDTGHCVAGILGVIPAAQLRDAKLASLYLGAFCLISTIVVGGFAAFYGNLSEWLV